MIRLIGAGSYGKVLEAMGKGLAGEYSAAVKIIFSPQTKEEVNKALSSVPVGLSEIILRNSSR